MRCSGAARLRCCATSTAHKASASRAGGKDTAAIAHLRYTFNSMRAPIPRDLRSLLMSVNTQENAPQHSAPFVDQLPDGPGVSKIDPSDPAAPLYQLLAKMRSPVTLRDLMIHPVRTGYIGQENPIDPADLPKSAAELYPDVRVSEVAVPSPAGRI